MSEVSLKKSSTPQLKHLKVAIDMKNLVLIDAGKKSKFYAFKTAPVAHAFVRYVTEEVFGAAAETLKTFHTVSHYLRGIWITKPFEIASKRCLRARKNNSLE